MMRPMTAREASTFSNACDPSATVTPSRKTARSVSKETGSAVRVSIDATLAATRHHRQVQAALASAVHRLGVTRISVAHDAGRRIIPQHPLDPLRCLGGAVAHNHDPGVLREAHADPAA